MSIEQIVSDSWQTLTESLERIKKRFTWFGLTLMIGLVPEGIFWLRETLMGNSLTFETLMLRGYILYFIVGMGLYFYDRTESMLTNIMHSWDLFRGLSSHSILSLKKTKYLSFSMVNFLRCKYKAF